MRKEIQKGERAYLKVKRTIIRYFVPLSIGIFITTSVIGYYGIILPERESFFKKVEEENLKIEDEIILKETQSATLKRSIKGHKVFQEQDIHQVMRMLPPSKDRIDLFLLINDILKKRGLYVRTFSMGDPIVLDQYFGEALATPLQIVVVPVTVEVEATLVTYDTIKDLFRILYNKHRIFNLQSIKLSDFSSNTQTGYTLNLDVFFLDDADEENDS